MSKQTQNVNKKTEHIERDHIEILKLKNTVRDLKTSGELYNGRSEQVEERISEPEESVTGVIQSEEQEKKKKKEQMLARVSFGACAKTTITVPKAWCHPSRARDGTAPCDPARHSKGLAGGFSTHGRRHQAAGSQPIKQRHTFYLLDFSQQLDTCHS